jgi:hypothetical protein
MSFYAARPTFATVLRSFTSADGLAFGDALPEADIQQACDAEGVHFGLGEQDVYTPAVTLWAFLAQWEGKSASTLTTILKKCLA